MKESTTYQAIKQEGRLEEVREDIRVLGERKFHKPVPADVRTALENILDLAQLKELLKRILDAESWEDFLESPTPQTRPARKKRK